ncbi:MAG: hypothetical protein Q4G58_09940 [bacterium]|nr:hypothetical protein [bacterium]
MELINEYRVLMDQIQQNTVTEEAIEEFIKKAEKEYQKELNVCLSFNHPVEACYYDYFVSKEAYTRVPVNMGYLYRTLGMMYAKENKLRKSETSYNRASRWNPVDLDTIYCLIENNKRENELEKVLKLTKKAYDFCCTRADLAHYYRNLGFYYLESYEPQLAKALYEYSQCFYETEQAANELAYIANALQQEEMKLSISEIQKTLQERGIPVQANPTTLAITYQVGKACLQSGDAESANDCFLMVYDVTGDEEVRSLLVK